MVSWYKNLENTLLRTKEPNMMHHFIATTAFGLEALVAQELRSLGFSDLKTSNGKVAWHGPLQDVVKANLWLRCADRIMIILGDFPAFTFDELFEGTKALPWEDWLPENAYIHVNGRAHNSQLMSVSDCQSIAKKAIIEALKRRYQRQYFPEDGAAYRIELALRDDQVQIALDTSGASLHKRGYRTEAGTAPLKETLAAALVLLSRWEPSRVLADPLCGSGTIAIEAAMIGRNQAPGLERDFAAEHWTQCPAQWWQDARDAAHAAILCEPFRILASDLDYHVLKKAMQNAELARVSDYVAFQKLDLAQFRSRKKYGCIIANPPYGERLGEQKAAIQVAKTLGELQQQLDTWSFFILTSEKRFEHLFGKKADKKRKLFNGNIECHFYQFFGPWPSSHEKG